MRLALVSENANNIKLKESENRNVEFNREGNVYSIISEGKQGERSARKQKGDKASPLKTLVEITSVIEYYENKANDNGTKIGYRQLADRNKLLCIVGFNVGVRASDLVKIRWSNIYDSCGCFLSPENEEIEGRRSAQVIEQKTQKVKDLIFNDVVKQALEEYVEKYGIDRSSSEYVFFSRQKIEGGEGYISREQVSNIIKEAVKACGIKRRVASHTFRKTFAYHQMMAHQDDAMFTSELMDLLNHDSEEATLHYVGLDVERRIQYHNDVQLGKISVIREHKKREINSEKEIITDRSDIEYLLKQLSERCYICSNDCSTCYNSILAKKYGYDLNMI